MAEIDFDGNITFRGGQNDSSPQESVGKDQYRKGVNLTTRHGVLSPRPAFIYQNLKFEDAEYNGKSIRTIFLTGKFQAAAPFTADNGKVLLVVISGLIFQIQNQKVRLLRLANNDRMNQYARRIHWSEAGRFLLFYDYPNANVVIEPASLARRSDSERKIFVSNTWLPMPEAPPAILGCYNNSRLFLARENEFIAGDPVGKQGSPDAPLTFEESLVDAQPFNGQSFSLGSSNINNPITAMGTMQIIDSSTGVGPMFVATRDSFYSYRTDKVRAEWESIVFGMMSLYDCGIVGNRGFARLNSDLVFQSGDNAIRSFSSSRNKATKWNDSPISKEVEGWLSFNDKKWDDLTVLQSWNNRVLATVKPAQCHAKGLDDEIVADYYFEGILALELDNTSSLREQASPAWVGLWTGVRPMEIIRLGDDLYIMAKEGEFPGNTSNALYKVEENLYQDYTSNSKFRDIECRLYTRDYSFSSKFMDKKILSADLDLSDLQGDLEIKAYYRRNESENWAVWTYIDQSLPVTTKRASTSIPLLKPHSVANYGIGSPADPGCSSLSDDSYLVFRSLQLMIEFKARNWQLNSIRLKSEKMPETNDNHISCGEEKINQAVDIFLPDFDFYRL